MNARVERGVDYRLERLELEELVDKPREGVVGVPGHGAVCTAHRGYPPSQLSVAFVLEQFVRTQDARNVVPRTRLVDVLEVARFQAPDIGGEQKQQDADCQPHLVAVEEAVRARRVDADTALLEALCKVACVAVLDRLKEKGDLVVVVDDPALLERTNESADGFAPVVLVVPDLDDGGRSLYTVTNGLDALLEAITIPVEPEPRSGRPLHPVVVESDDSRVGAVVVRQRNLFTPAIPELFGELQDVTNGRAAEAVKALIIVANDTDVAAGLPQQQRQLFLDVIGVLILIDHYILDLLVHFG